MTLNVGWFCTDAHGENVAMRTFLARFEEEVSRRERVALRLQRLGRHTRVPSPTTRGVPVAGAPKPTGRTGADLLADVRRFLRDQPEEARRYDALLVIDDADCRCAPHDDPMGSGVSADCTSAMVRAIQVDAGPPVFVWLLSPTMEVALVADWEATFGAHPAYRARAHGLRQRLKGELHDRAIFHGGRFGDWSEVERCGYPRPGDTCSWKLSDALVAACRAEQLPDYKKGSTGPELLARARPGKVAERCKRLFGPARQAFEDHLVRVARER